MNKPYFIEWLEQLFCEHRWENKGWWAHFDDHLTQGYRFKECIKCHKRKML